MYACPNVCPTCGSPCEFYLGYKDGVHTWHKCPAHARWKDAVRHGDGIPVDLQEVPSVAPVVLDPPAYARGGVEPASPRGPRELKVLVSADHYRQLWGIRVVTGRPLHKLIEDALDQYLVGLMNRGEEGAIQSS